MKDFDRHVAAWRDPSQVVSHWQDAADVEPGLLDHVATGEWWEAIQEAGVTLLVSRETEHLVLALSVERGRPDVSYFRLPHPSGLAADRQTGRVYLAGTRNPNQVLVLEPSTHPGRTLLPRVSWFYPGSLYIHDLALIGSDLFANAVGQNAVVRLAADVPPEPVWWPRSIDSAAGPRFDRNYLQLNSIAPGLSIHDSYYSASASAVSRRRPGHLDFPVNGRGVIFSGATREPIVRGLTRPHSARLHDGRLWVDDSGYGTFGWCEDEQLRVVTRLPGWTRGLTFAGTTAFVGTSHVIRRFARYAPGVDPDRTICGVHAIDTRTGRVRGSITWASGNQIFGLDWLPRDQSAGLPFRLGQRASAVRDAFYAYQLTDGTSATKDEQE